MNRIILFIVFAVILPACSILDNNEDSISPDLIQNALTQTKWFNALMVAPPGDLPNSAITPGALCTSSDPDFDGFRYDEYIPHCKRHVTASMKDMIAKKYGVKKANYNQYEFDHYIPLSIGGKNDITNIWPQILYQAKNKDVLEFEVYQDISNGEITQAEAIAKIRAWQYIR